MGPARFEAKARRRASGSPFGQICPTMGPARFELAIFAV